MRVLIVTTIEFRKQFTAAGLNFLTLFHKQFEWHLVCKQIEQKMITFLQIFFLKISILRTVRYNARRA